MGRNQHSKDRLFLTATEWKRDYGGKKADKNGASRPLAFDCCALSLAPFETPVCTKEGVIFDILNIMPYVRKHKKNPVTGEALTPKDLVRLNISKNADGKWHCPVTFKVFNDNSRILAIKSSGNVFAAEAVEELNYKAKSWNDLLTGEEFTKRDVIKLNDPGDKEFVASRDVNNFVHLSEVREERVAELAKVAHADKIRQTKSTELIFREIGAKRKRDAAEKAAKDEEDRKTAKEREEAGLAAGERLWKRGKVTTEDLVGGRIMTSGKTSGSFTSSALAVSTESKARLATDDEINDARWYRLRKLGKKGYCQLQTTKGNINVEIHCDIVPRMAENFLGLCEKEYYDGTKFHRSIRNFMLQGGDPTGSGRGGESYWGGKIKDEFESRMTHDKRGVLSMANSGPDTTGSQFFITYKSCKHLDNQHSVFGRVVGGMPALAAIEAVPTDSKDKPREDYRAGQGDGVQQPRHGDGGRAGARAAGQDRRARSRGGRKVDKVRTARPRPRPNRLGKQPDARSTAGHQDRSGKISRSRSRDHPAPLGVDFVGRHDAGRGGKSGRS
ncbi:conserved unknown protein [Ectocarpus siliculosus]|uniref:RING-type E3 ubiquitin-protein ligase PPIL2 n=1 Tax=Ectocarpus siliculosus TaxID=2880 RepID=D8LLL2_ECTSI|nr:conserved unknown protein [Ectocarpus siliculosus]|eukprot:CBN74643.1 conserved unknown protein [Ectocarpus siliculosus]